MDGIRITKRAVSSAIAAGVTIGLAASAAQAFEEYAPQLSTSMSGAQIDAAINNAKPIERLLDKLPADTSDAAAPSGPPKVSPGKSGPASVTARNNDPKASADEGIGSQNYGKNNRNTIWHYNDYLLPTILKKSTPWRKAGWFYIKGSDGKWGWCSAALIRYSMIVTAGHCVHDGGNKSAGWIKDGWFYPSRSGGSFPYARARIRRLYTTSGWYNSGKLDQGYDVALVILNVSTATNKMIGLKTGYFGFCYANCLQPYWFMTQLGYPGNYYSGRYMTVSQHLEKSDGRDYRYGTGMRGGSSGGPHISNIYRISDSSTYKGSYTSRDIIFDVTSWGYISHDPKIQGASSLSGPSNRNNFKNMFNAACSRHRGYYGSWTCKSL